jgi:hypothetical protein
MRLTLSPDSKLISAFLLKVVAALLFFDLLAIFAKDILGYSGEESIIRLFDMRREANIPAFYSTLAIWFCAALLWQIYTGKKKSNSKEAVHWKVMCFVFVFLGFDELLLIHEKTKGISAYITNYIQLPIKDLYWIISYGILLVFFAGYFFRFYWNLSKTTRIQFTIAGFVYIGGTIGIEFLGGLYVKRILGGSYNLPVGLPAFGYDLLVAAEETLEMLGIVLFIRALLVYIRNMPSYPVLTVELKNRSDQSKELVQKQAERTFISNVNTFTETATRKKV